MSNFEDLVQEYCLNGVPLRKVGALLKKAPVTEALPKSEYRSAGAFPVINQSQELIAAYSDMEEKALPNGSYIVFGDHTRAIKWANFRFIPGESGTLVFNVVDGVEAKYIYHVLKNLRITSRGYNRHWTVLREFDVPLPPIEVQREIVRILDTFTDLEAELEAELEARKSQFSNFLDLVFDNEKIRTYGSSKLADHGVFDRGNGLQKTDFSEVGVGCIHYGQIYTKFGSHAQDVYTYVPEKLASKLKNVTPGNLVVTTTSENIQDVCKAVAWLGKSDIVIGGHSCVYRHDLDPLFATYLFRSRIFQDQKNLFVQGTKVKDIKPMQIGKIEVFIPPMREQIVIGKMLRDFDALIADKNFGLPAEISARRDQYEYYRSRLLTFKELEIA
jgi:type I restriction enzyme S subunit